MGRKPRVEYKGEDIENGVKILAKLMRESANTVVLTGAGMDTESNIPDFRGKNGWWKSIDPRLVASIDSFYENYELFHEFYTTRIKRLEDIKPHEGHYILADFERRGIIKSIATQNVSGLHHMAGSKKVYELHGNIKKIKCNQCNHETELKDFFNKKNCSLCGNLLRPDVVLFGEALPADVWALAENDIRKCDLLIVIGTSLEVYPVNQFPKIAKSKTVFINNEDISFDHEFDIKLIGKAKEVLKMMPST
ncbi:MAG: NAD-dependent deacylase [Tepidanaerobacteraceae bacterium]|nr:NAD-dependent deacylase [Tepidanaerobacteraceae bacterium]